MLTPLIGFGAGGAGLELIFRSSAVSGANNATYTFSAMAIGAAAADRLVIAVVASHDSADTAGEAPTSVTIGGVTATLHVHAVGTGTNEGSVTICSAIVPTGTTADVVATWAAARVRAGAGLYTLANYAGATPVATNQNTATVDSTTIAIDLTVAFDQIGVVGATSRSATASTVTWTNAAEDFDVAMEASESSISGAHVAAGSGAVTVTATMSNTGSPCIAGAVWG